MFKPSIRILAVCAVSAALLGTGSTAQAVNTGLKAMSQIGGGGLSGVWRQQYDSSGSTVPGTFGPIESVGDARFVNTEGFDVDGDGRQEVIFGFNGAALGSFPTGIWMIDLDSNNDPVPGTFFNIDSGAGPRRIEVAAGDMGSAGGDAFVLSIQNNLMAAAGVPSGIWRLIPNTDAAGIFPGSFQRILNLPEDHFFSGALVDGDNDGEVELFLYDHHTDVDFENMVANQVDLLMFETTEDGIVGGLDAYFNNDFTPILAESFSSAARGNPLYIGPGGGDIDNDGMFELARVINDFDGSSFFNAAQVGSGRWLQFDNAGNVTLNQAFNLDDTNRRTDMGITGANIQPVSIPEPSTFAAVIFGIVAGVGLCRQRRVHGR